MQEYEKILTQYQQKSIADIENRVAWFYLRFLFEQKDQSILMNASTVLVPRDRAKLPTPNGRQESAILKRKSVLKKDFLNAQLCDIVDTYGNELRMTGEPQTVRKKLDARLDKFITETSQKMSAEVQRGLMQNSSPDLLVQKLSSIFTREAKQVGAFAQDCYTQANWYRLLQNSEENSDQLYTLVVFESDGTCERCRSHGGKLYTLKQLEEEDLLPPLHPNCQCAVVPKSENSEEQGAWYDAFLRIPEDAWNMLQAFAGEQAARFNSGTLGGFLDGLTLGIVSGFFNGLIERNDKMWQDPSLYNIGNWLTLGLFDLTKGALNPDEPLSLQHWMDSIGFATAVYGAYKVAQGVRGNGKLDKKPTADTDTSVANGSESKIPQNYLDEALKQQNLKNAPNGFKQTWIENGYRYEVRVHVGESQYTNANSIYRVSRRQVPIPGVQGTGTYYLGTDGNWYHTSVLRQFNGDGSLNPLYNANAARITHIPLS